MSFGEQESIDGHVSSHVWIVGKQETPNMFRFASRFPSLDNNLSRQGDPMTSDCSWLFKSVQGNLGFDMIRAETRFSSGGRGDDCDG